MSTIAQAKPGTPLEAPIIDLRGAGFVTSLFQGCAYAVDPRTPFHGYVFQLQAVRVGPNDVEDLRIHRFRYHPDGTPEPLTYVDTMTVLRGGHVQSCHVRISAAGNPYVWAGLEQYDKAGNQIGKALYRFRYQTSVPVRADSLPRVYTGPGSVDAIGCPNWTVVLRRPGDKSDTFEWHSEKNLLGTQSRYKGTTRPKPVKTKYAQKTTSDDDYQSALAQGKWNADSVRAYRISGADVIRVLNTDTPHDALYLTAQAAKLLGVDHVEPEGAFTLGGILHVAVQTGSTAQRRVSYIPLRW